MMKEQELKEHIRRAKVAQWYVLTMLIGVCLAIFFYVRFVVLEESEDEIPLAQQGKGIAVAIVYSSFEVRGGKDMDEVYGFGGAGVFYVGDKRYFCDLETLQVVPPVGLRFPVYYNIENPEINRMADIPKTDSIVRSPYYCWELQKSGIMQFIDTVSHIDRGIYENVFLMFSK